MSRAVSKGWAPVAQRASLFLQSRSFFFTFGSLALVTGRFSLQSIVSGVAWDKPLFPIFIVVSSISIFFLMITGCSRMPADDPNTHLLLSIIHEVMILDLTRFHFMLY